MKIVNDYYPEEDEQLLVQLELKTGSASVDYHSAMVVIIGGQVNAWSDVLRKLHTLMLAEITTF